MVLGIHAARFRFFQEEQLLDGAQHAERQGRVPGGPLPQRSALPRHLSPVRSAGQEQRLGRQVPRTALACPGQGVRQDRGVRAWFEMMCWCQQPRSIASWSPKAVMDRTREPDSLRALQQRGRWWRYSPERQRLHNVRGWTRWMNQSTNNVPQFLSYPRYVPSTLFALFSMVSGKGRTSRYRSIR